MSMVPGECFVSTIGGLASVPQDDFVLESSGRESHLSISPPNYLLGPIIWVKAATQKKSYINALDRQDFDSARRRLVDNVLVKGLADEAVANIARRERLRFDRSKGEAEEAMMQEPDASPTRPKIILEVDVSKLTARHEPTT